MSVIFTRAPLRLSLGGGGTDLPSYYERARRVPDRRRDRQVHLHGHPHRLPAPLPDEVLRVRGGRRPSEIRHPILRETLLRHWSGEPLEIASIADVPAGTGMGSSGAYTVCLLKALALAKRIVDDARPRWPSRRARSRSTCSGSRSASRTSTSPRTAASAPTRSTPTARVDVEPLELSTRDAGQAAQQLPALLHGRGAQRVRACCPTRWSAPRAATTEMLANLDRTKEMGLQSRDLLLEPATSTHTRELMHEHWENKRRRSPGMVNRAHRHLYTLARRAGAIGGKLVGAGGGGFLLVYAQQPEDVRQAMAAAGAPRSSPFDFEFQGCSGTEYA